MTVINLYSVPILVEQLSDRDSLTEDETEILKTVSLQKQYGEDGNYLSEESHVLQHYKLDRIKALCDKHVSLYTESVLGIDDKFKMFRSWLSMNVDGSLHEQHSHRNTMISCIMYFDDYMSNQPMAPINFWQDGLDQIFKTFQFAFNRKQPNQYNNNTLTIYPKTNTLIVFPGWIKHSTEKSISKTRRYCLGTNYFFEGSSASGYHHITINIK